MTRALQLLAVCIFFFLIPTVAWPQGSAATQPITELERSALFPSRELLSQGEKVAGSACVSCHGINGISMEPGVPHLAGQRTVYLYRVLQSYQSRERRNDSMVHAAGFLNDEALLAVTAYYASLVPARPVLTDDKPLTAGEVVTADPFTGIRESMKKMRQVPRRRRQCICIRNAQPDGPVC